MKNEFISLALSLAVGSLAAFPIAADSQQECRRTLTDSLYDCLETLMDMRAIQTAIEAYGIDHPTYPVAASMAELRALVQPAYIAKTPMKDAWGTEFRYVPSPDGASYRLVSAGSDRVFQEKTWDESGFLSSSKADAVLCPDEEDFRRQRQWVIQQ